MNGVSCKAMKSLSLVSAILARSSSSLITPFNHKLIFCKLPFLHPFTYFTTGKCIKSYPLLRIVYPPDTSASHLTLPPPSSVFCCPRHFNAGAGFVSLARPFIVLLASLKASSDTSMLAPPAVLNPFIMFGLWLVRYLRVWEYFPSQVLPVWL